MGLFSSLKDKVSGPKPKPQTSPTQAQPKAPQGMGVKPPPPPVALPGVKHAIAVASGKGGVGKSTSAVSLAYALVQQGYQVGLLDADIYGPSLPTMLGLSQPPMQKGDKIEPPQKDGIKMLSMGMLTEAGQPSILRGPMAAAVIKQFLTQVDWGQLDYLVIDYPPGTGDIQLTISQTIAVTGAVMVTTPSEVALLDVRKAIGMFGTIKVPVVGIVETMSYFECECNGETTRHHLFGQGGGEKLSKENGVALLAQVPIDERVNTACDQGQVSTLMTEHKGYSAAFLSAAESLAKRCSMLGTAQADAKQSFHLDWQS